MARWRLSLQTRLIALVAGGLLAVTVLFGALGLQAVDRSMHRGLRQQLEVAQLLARYVDWVLNEQLRELNSMCAAAVVDPQTHAVTVAQQLSPEPPDPLAKCGLVALDGNGAPLWAEEPDPAVRAVTDEGAAALQKAARDGTRVVTTARLAGAEGPRALVGMAVPMATGSADSARLLLAVTDAGHFTEILGTAQQDSAGVFEIIDAQGRVIASSEPSDTVAEDEHSRQFAAWIDSESPIVTSCHSCHRSESATEVQSDYLAFAPMRSASWGVAVRRPATVVSADARELGQNLIMAGSGALAVILVLSFWTGRRLLQSLSSLTEATQRIARGDLSQQIAVQGGDELAALASSFDQMRARLQKSLEELKDYSQDLERRVHERTADLELRNRELSAVTMVATAASGAVDIDRLMNRALERALEATGLEAGGLMLWDATGTGLSYKVARGFSEQFMQEIGSLRPGEGVAGQVALDGEPMVVADISAHPLLTKDVVRREGLRAFASIPLAAGGQVLGVLNVASRQPGQIDPALVKILSSIGQQIGLAIERARLREEASKVKALQELDAMKSQLLTMVSHELRTPLASIKGQATALLSEGRSRDEQTVRRYVRGIDRDADALRGLIDNLLDMSRIEAGALHLDLQPVDMILLARRAVTSVRRLARHQRFVIRFPTEFPTVEGDARRLEQVFRNLLENAVKYAPGGAIVVEATVEGDEVHISVADEGPGIPADKLARVFQPFFRLHARPDHTEGIGLGLAICRGLIEAHGGRIWIESGTAGGCKVVFALPLIQAPTEAGRPTGTSTTPASGERQ